MVITPKVRGFICTTSHPDGCAAHVQEQIDYVQSQPQVIGGPKNVLIIGSSTGYGLSSRIVSAFGCGAGTTGVYFERPGTETKPGSAGYYNSAAFTKAAEAAGLYTKDFNGDAFSDDMKGEVVAALKEGDIQVDLVIYSLASPKRKNPRTGEVSKSVLKPIGQNFTAKNLNTDKGLVDDITIEPASQDEINATVKVMGGEDWEWWMEALAEGGVLADGAKAVAYSYIGPEVTWPVYRDGTIGTAKLDLDECCTRIDALLQKSVGGSAVVSVNKAVVTQASSAIPVVPLYLSILLKEMAARDIHEGCIEQIQRLFAEHLYAENAPARDDTNRIRIDDWEMRDDVQAAVKETWSKITTENLDDLSDFAGYKTEFLRLFGFGLDGVDYSAETNPLR
ncbi:MAG: enoyl-ACP reductase FabV [Verrucomicrobiota bacterium]